MKALVKIFGIALFDFIAIYGSATIFIALLWRIKGWGMNPYFVFAALALGRIFEMYLEKLDKYSQQMAANMLMGMLSQKMHREEGEDDDEEDTD